MKINRIFTLCALAGSLFLSAHSVSAQSENGGDQGGRRNRGGGGNFDPAQFQQRMMDNVRDQLGFTNDTEWSAIQPLIQKVMDARRDVGMGGMSRLFRGRSSGGDQGGSRRGGGMFGQSSPEAEALQKALDDNSPAAQVKAALEKYRSTQKDKETKLETAQNALKQVLTVKQEAQAALLGLVN